MPTTTFSANGRTYAMPPDPVVVICIDGSEPDYHEAALAASRMPWLEKITTGAGRSWPAECAMPALTNPNNLSIATGQPPAVHGISGNYLYDTDSGREVLMNSPRFLRAPTLFAAANEAGLDVAVVTAKDKLRRLLGAGLVEAGPDADGAGQVEPSRRGICFSAERADEATVADNGIDGVMSLVGLPKPSVYSAALSEFTLAAGVRLLETRRPDLLYLSLTDFVQHKNSPGSPRANDFYAMIDRYADQLDRQGALVVLTADHGMSAKSHDDGRPRVIYIEDEITRLLDTDGTPEGLRVILPITDPYTAHHGALGTTAYVYLPAGADQEAVRAGLSALSGIQEVRPSSDAAARYRLPPDRIGDLVVIGAKDTALGRNRDWHDLTQLREPLRSHGGLGELTIPFLVNRPLPDPRPSLPDGVLHNYDAFWVATSGAQA